MPVRQRWHPTQTGVIHDGGTPGAHPHVPTPRLDQGKSASSLSIRLRDSGNMVATRNYSLIWRNSRDVKNPLRATLQSDSGNRSQSPIKTCETRFWSQSATRIHGGRESAHDTPRLTVGAGDVCGTDFFTTDEEREARGSRSCCNGRLGRSLHRELSAKPKAAVSKCVSRAAAPAVSVALSGPRASPCLESVDRTPPAPPDKRHGRSASDQKPRRATSIAK
jgi:hypothetical protein